MFQLKPNGLTITNTERVTGSLVLYVCFVDRCLSFCHFSFGHCVLLYGSWLTLCYLQTLLHQRDKPRGVWMSVNNLQMFTLFGNFCTFFLFINLLFKNFDLSENRQNNRKEKYWKYLFSFFFSLKIWKFRQGIHTLSNKTNTNLIIFFNKMLELKKFKTKFNVLFLCCCQKVVDMFVYLGFTYLMPVMSMSCQ